MLASASFLSGWPLPAVALVAVPWPVSPRVPPRKRRDQKPPRSARCGLRLFRCGFHWLGRGGVQGKGVLLRSQLDHAAEGRRRLVLGFLGDDSLKGVGLSAAQIHLLPMAVFPQLHLHKEYCGRTDQSRYEVASKVDGDFVSRRFSAKGRSPPRRLPPWPGESPPQSRPIIVRRAVFMGFILGTFANKLDAAFSRRFRSFLPNVLINYLGFLGSSKLCARQPPPSFRWPWTPRPELTPSATGCRFGVVDCGKLHRWASIESYQSRICWR